MKHKLIPLAAALALLPLNAANAYSGNLFNVTSSGAPINISITLCLNAIAMLSCQTYTVTGSLLSIKTTIDHQYPNAGIKSNSPDYTPSGCTTLANGFCSFTANSSTPASIPLTSGSSGIVFVGSYFNGSHYVPLSYTSNNNGAMWSISSPLPLASPGPGVINVLYRTACSSSKTICSAVGNYNVPGFVYPLTYTSNNGGSSWQLSLTLPSLPVGSTQAVLFDVSCDSAGQQCVAVGNSYDGSVYSPVVYTTSNAGVAWTMSSALTIPLHSVHDTYLKGISCSSNGSICTAIGYYSNSGNVDGVAYTSGNGGNSWSLGSAILAPVSPSYENYLKDVACNGSGAQCAAVGTYISGGNQVPISYVSTNSGSSWTASLTQPPVPVGGTYGTLTAINCTNGGNICTAVGSYYNGTTTLPLVVISTTGGNTWTLSATQPPLPLDGTTGYLNLVSCNSTGTACSAAGTYNNGNDTPLAYTSADSGNTWSLSSPQPSLPAGGSNGILGGINT